VAKIDDLDLTILSELSADASISVPKLSDKIKVNPSVVYSRIKRLVKKKTFVAWLLVEHGVRILPFKETYLPDFD